MLSSSQYTMLKLSKTTYPQKLFLSDFIKLYILIFTVRMKETSLIIAKKKLSVQIIWYLLGGKSIKKETRRQADFINTWHTRPPKWYSIYRVNYD